MTQEKRNDLILGLIGATLGIGFWLSICAITLALYILK